MTSPISTTLPGSSLRVPAGAGRPVSVVILTQGTRPADLDAGLTAVLAQRDVDLDVNVCREKKLTNVRSATAEKTIILKAPRQMTLNRRSSTSRTTSWLR